MSLTVNGIPLDEREVVEEIGRLRPKHEEVFRSVSDGEREEQLRAWARENIIERMLLRQAAEAYRVSIPRELLDESFRSLVVKEGGEEELWRKLSVQGTSLADFRREFERQFYMDTLVDSVTRDVPPAAEEELRERYVADLSRFTTPDIVRAGHIVLHVDHGRTREEALDGIQEIRKMFMEGRDFEELAAAFSDCPENDGDMGWFPKGEGEFESAVFDMTPGEVSGIIETPSGIHIAKLYEKRCGSLLPFEAVRDALSAERVQELKDQMLEKFIDSLRSAANIVEEP